jgi:hypothetical protein
LLPLARSLGISLSTISTSQPKIKLKKKIGWGRKGGGWEWGAILFIFEFPTQIVVVVLPQKYALWSSSLAIVNASQQHVLMISWSLSFFKKIQASLHSTNF